MSVKCPTCNSDNTNTAKFCSECAAPLHPSVDIGVTETIEAPKEELTTGSTFAHRYQIIEELGKGGMGKVYKALDKEINAKVALKLIKPEISADDKTIERFRNELRIARDVSHKNVCRMYDLNKEEGSYFITMEYVSGEDLRSFIRRSRQLAVGTAITIAKQVCEGLSEAHKSGVVHRDLKPSNIMIDKEGNARIMDFGIARSLEAKGITGAGVMIGTPEYMSPEQAEAKEVDYRSDIYSLGVILYEMVTGQLPFEGDTPLSVAMKHKGEVPKNPKEYNAQIPDDFSNLILKCLEKDKEKRYQSAGEVRAELEKIEKGIPTTTKAVPKRKPITSKEITFTFGLKKLFIPALIFIAIIVIGLIFWHTFLQKKAVPIPTEIQSIAVLPFEDLSPNKDQEYLCDGIADELINRLINIEGLKVPARTSAFSFKGKGVDVRDIGKKLEVENILEGSIRKAGKKLRITVQLVNVVDGIPLWSEKYERDEEDIFALQDEISLKIVGKLKLKLLGRERERVVKRHTESVEAYNLYLQGRYFWNKRTKQGMKRSIEFFTMALQEDPNYALAYAGLADCYMTGSGRYLDLPGAQAIQKGMAVAMKALEIDEALVEAHASIAGSLSGLFDWEASEKEFRRAIELNPNYATARHWYAEALWSMGRHEEAIAQAKRAKELDPLSLIVNTALGVALYFAGRYIESIEQYNYTLELDPNFQLAHYYLGFAYLQQSKFEEAIEELKEAYELMDGPENLAALGYAYALTGKKSEAEKILVELNDLSNSTYVSFLDIAMIYAGLEKKGLALEWLEKAVREKSARVKFLKVDPVFFPVKSDPRFQDLIRKLNLPEN